MQEQVQEAIWREVHQSSVMLLHGRGSSNLQLKVTRGVWMKCGFFGSVAGSDGTCEFGDDFHAGTKRICVALPDI